jgi:hypothetical protein
MRDEMGSFGSHLRRMPYWMARYEHAYRMRIAGESYSRIGARLGVTRERIRLMVRSYPRIEPEMHRPIYTSRCGGLANA